MRGLSRVIARSRVASWEWALAVFVLFMLGRMPLLFVRQRLAGVLGGPAAALWQEDAFIQIALSVVLLPGVVLAFRRAHADALVQQLPLLVFVAIAWASTAWSVQPDVTLWRAGVFAATVIVGWYLGTRFSPTQQPWLVAGVATVGSAASLVVAAVWPDIATRTASAAGRWSGVYVNRNTLGLVMSLGLLALVFLVAGQPPRFWLVWLGPVFAALLITSGSRTGEVALAVSLAIAAFVMVLRKAGRGTLTSAGAAVITLVVAGAAGYVVHVEWPAILEWLGRNPTLTSRTIIWELARWFSNLHPWLGWGFEAIWADPHAIGQAQAARGMLQPAVPGGWPYSAHSGYLEILLGVGRLGLAAFVVFLAVAAWQAFRHAWRGEGVASLWPLSIIVFAVVANFSESLFVAGEAMMALTVAAAVGTRTYIGRKGD